MSALEANGRDRQQTRGAPSYEWLCHGSNPQPVRRHLFQG